MTRTRTFLIMPLALLISGCAAGGGNGSNLPSLSGGSHVGLSLREIDAVTVAARTMLNDDRAQVRGLKSRKDPANSSIHVCGYVTSAATGEKPIYVELRPKNATVHAERGQVATAPDKLAKVRFMCRGHGDW